MQVKQLEWKNECSKNTYVFFEISKNWDKTFMLFINPRCAFTLQVIPDYNESFDTIEKAKQKAQELWEQFILSNIESKVTQQWSMSKINELIQQKISFNTC